jgi:hypothetical protein
VRDDPIANARDGDLRRATPAINRMYEPRVMSEIRRVRREASEPELFDRLLHVLEEQRGHTLAMDVEQAKIALSDTDKFDFSPRQILIRAPMRSAIPEV